MQDSPEDSSEGRKKILIVEDDVEFQELLGKLLHSKGYIVESSNDGSNAISRLDHTRYDAIILDIKLPGVNGLQVAADAKNSKENSKTPAIIVSGHLDEESAKRATQIGVAEIMVKPPDFDLLLKRLQELTKNKLDTASYDKLIIKAFVGAVKQIFEFYFEKSPEIGRPFIKKNNKTKGHVSGIIGFAGENLTGSMSMTSNLALVEILSKQIFQEQELQLTDEMIGDLSGEICNQVVGKLKINLSKIGLKINIGLPEVVIGKNHSLIHKTANPVLCVPVCQSDAECSLEISMTDAVNLDVDQTVVENETVDETVENVILFD